MNLTLTYDEAVLVDECLRHVHAKMLEAWEAVQAEAAHRSRFTARDFGLPQIEGILTKLEALQ